jgi:hypothetical protein
MYSVRAVLYGSQNEQWLFAFCSIDRLIVAMEVQAALWG